MRPSLPIAALSLAALLINIGCYTSRHVVDHAPDPDEFPVLQGHTSRPHQTLADVIVDVDCSTAFEFTSTPRSGSHVLNVVEPTRAEELALEALREAAADLGADAVVDARASYHVYLRLPPLVSLLDLCRMTAFGTAMKFETRPDSARIGHYEDSKSR